MQLTEDEGQVRPPTSATQCRRHKQKFGLNPRYTSEQERSPRQRPLADWKGDRVLWSGPLEYWEPDLQKPGHYKIALQPVQVTHWRTRETRHLHHLWFSASEKEFDRRIRLSTIYFGCGVVYTYIRGDRSKDFAIAAEKGKNILKVLASLPSYMSSHPAWVKDEIVQLRQAWNQGMISLPADLPKPPAVILQECEELLIEWEQRMETVMNSARFDKSVRESFAAPGLSIPRQKRRSPKGVG